MFVNSHVLMCIGLEIWNFKVCLLPYECPFCAFPSIQNLQASECHSYDPYMLSLERLIATFGTNHVKRRSKFWFHGFIACYKSNCPEGATLPLWDKNVLENANF